MNMLEILLYSMGVLGSASTFSYLDGRAKAAFVRNQSQYRPPYFFGVLTSIVWPLQLVAGLLFVALVVPRRKGEGRGLEINEELSSLRKQARDKQMEDAVIIKMLNDGISPDHMLRAIHGEAVKQLEGKPNELDDIVSDARMNKGDNA